MNQRRLILEGISGAGKTVQARRLWRRLKASASVAIVSEFSRGSIGRTIRRRYHSERQRFVHFHSKDRFSDQTHLVLLADTIAKVEEMSQLTVEVVLVERLFDSWLCYTLAAGSRCMLTDSAVRDLHLKCSEEHVSGDSITVFLELDAATAIRRLATRDGFGQEESEDRRLESVAWQFSELYADTSIIRVDARRTPLEVTEEIIDAVGGYF